MAQGDYGTSSNPLEQIHSEQVVYEPLTSDPSDREEGSEWFRADMDSGDKVGTMRLQNDDGGSDIDDWPAFAEAGSVDGVVKMFPIQTENGEAFLPYAEEGGTFDQKRFQHNGTWYGAHRYRTEIPNSAGVHQWNFTEGSGTSVADEIGALTLNFTGLSWGTGAGANNTYGILNGVDEYATLNTDDFEPLRNSGTGTIFIWHRLDSGASTSINYQLLTTLPTSSGTNLMFRLFNGGEYDFSLAIEGSFTSTRGGTVSPGDWVAMAATADGSTMRLYTAEPPGYDVTQLDSGSVPGTTTNQWSNTPAYGSDSRGTDEPFDGDVDVSFYDDTAWSEAELQTFVDDTQGYFT